MTDKQEEESAWRSRFIGVRLQPGAQRDLDTIRNALGLETITDAVHVALRRLAKAVDRRSRS